MPFADCRPIVMPDNTVTRGIPVSNPIQGPSSLEGLSSQHNTERERAEI